MSRKKGTLGSPHASPHRPGFTSVRPGAEPQEFQVGPGVDLDEAGLQKGRQAYKGWHWGIDARQVVDWDDADYPETLVECGRLVRLQIRLPRAEGKKRHPRHERDTMIELSQKMSANSHIAYDPSDKYQRLYLLIPEEAREAIRQRFWDDNSFAPMALTQVAQVAGGHHQGGYPNLDVKPIGIATVVVYWTNKQGDGFSYYAHQFGEVSGRHPILCCDEQGRLWLAGSSTTAPTPGITD